MNPIAKMLLDMARFYAHDLDNRTLDLYVDVLSQWPAEEVLAAGKAYVRNPKNTRFPIPPHTMIAETHAVAADAKDLARDTAMKVQHAVSKFGWNNPRGAREYIGDAGWVTVERFGGWEYVCANLGVELQVTTFIAQCRDSIESQVNLERMGFNPALPAIEQSRESKRGQGLVAIGDVIKGLLPPKDVK